LAGLNNSVLSREPDNYLEICVFSLTLLRIVLAYIDSDFSRQQLFIWLTDFFHCMTRK